jgi:hypothetical protein
MKANLLRAELIDLLDRYSRNKPSGDLVLSEVRLYRSTTCGLRMPTLYNPSICVQVDVNPRELGDIVLYAAECKVKNTTKLKGIVTGGADYALEDCFVRLLRLLDTPDHIPVLAPMIKKEIYYRLLKSEHAEYIADMVLQGSNLSKIAAAIQLIKSKLFQTLSIESLARRVGMSLSSFHAHFKSVTNISPLQFQKNLQLMEARQLMLVQSMDAANPGIRFFIRGD